MPKRKRYVPPKSRHQDNDSNSSLSDDGSEDGSSVDLDYGNNISSDDEKEEVLPVVDDSEDEEEDDNVDDDDESEASNEEDTVNLDAWGRKKSTYFNTDFVDQDRGKSYREEDKEIALAEEEGAFQVAQKFTAGFGAKSKFSASVKEPVVKEDKEDAIDATADWDSMNKEQKLQALMKKNPEFVPMLKEFKQMVVELKQLILKYNELVETSKESAEPVKMKLQLMLHCAMNCSMYIVMQTRRESIRNHPLLEDLKKFKSMLKTLKELESTSSKAPKPQLKKQKLVRFASDAVKETNVAEMNERDEEEEQDEEETGADGDETTQEKRSVTYQIAKNKGLTPHRKKEYRNPRVRHRMKYKKALIRRKGQVRTPRTEKERYGGEISGIQPNVTKSIKFK